MADPTVHITNGIPDSGTGNITTLGSVVSSLSDGTQKAKIVDGSGNVIGSTSNALDVNIKSLSGGNANGPALPANCAPVTAVSGGVEWETVAVSQTDQVMGATGAAGDYLEGVLCVVATAANSQVQIKDGAGSAITILPNAVGAGVGTYYVPLGLVSLAGAWKLTTASGVTAIGIGNFT